MPYIKQEDRNLPNMLQPQTPGQLNYAITQIAINYLGKTPNYQRYNDVLGALEGAKLEIYRTRVAPYEDQKMVENGNVY